MATALEISAVQSSSGSIISLTTPDLCSKHYTFTLQRGFREFIPSKLSENDDKSLDYSFGDSKISALLL